MKIKEEMERRKRKEKERKKKMTKRKSHKRLRENLGPQGGKERR